MCFLVLILVKLNVFVCSLLRICNLCLTPDVNVEGVLLRHCYCAGRIILQNIKFDVKKISNS